MAYAQHLARYTIADLALDTTPYTSHTTSSDALWCGCPIVGLVDKNTDLFAARVSGSVLTATGLTDLITEDLQQYEQRILQLAQIPGELQSVRSRLHHARQHAPMFDASRFTRDLEALYKSLLRV